MNISLQDKRYDYFAFISYKREDEEWAKWLQKKLESFSLPTAIRKENPELPDKIRPVFRDQSELSGGNLKAEIEKGLNGSKYLIVICSPRSAKSPWVSKEVQHFIDQGREEYIIPFIIGGSPNATNPQDECFPVGLRQLTGEKEILGININEMGRDAAAIKVIARMFNVRFDSLWQRHEKEKRRKRWTLGFVALIVILTLSGFLAHISKQNEKLSIANAKIIEERDRANIEKNKAETANKNLAKANDSINYQANMIILSNDSLNKINNILTSTIRDLGIERNNVLLKTVELQKEQLRLVSKQAEILYEEGNILRAYQLIRPFAVEISNHKMPYSPEIASLINKIKWHLSGDGYKIIENLTNSDTFNDSVYVSPNLLYNPYAQKGKFYLRDIRKGQTIILPGEDRIDECDFQFGKDTLYYRGLVEPYLWNLSKQTQIQIPDTYYPIWNEDLEEIETFTLPNITKPIIKYILNYDDIPDIRDYDILDVVKNNGYYIASLDSNEILVKKKLLSRRNLPISFNSGQVKPSYCSEFVAKKIISDSIIYNNKLWHKIDQKNGLQLYKIIIPEGDSGDELLLMDYNNKPIKEFTPFIAYNMGNGIGYLETAFILTKDEILCVSGQTEHEIYNTKLDTRTDFQSGNLEGWLMGHVGLYLANAFLLDENTLCDVRINGQITIYDIPSRLVIDEYDIPYRGWLEDGRMSDEVLLIGNRIIIIYENCIYQIPLMSKIESISEDIKLIDQFWD